jgi:hypothetical protein
MDEMVEFLNQRDKAIFVYDDNLTRRLVERVKVHKNHLTVVFRSGIEIDA